MPYESSSPAVGTYSIPTGKRLFHELLRAPLAIRSVIWLECLRKPSLPLIGGVTVETITNYLIPACVLVGILGIVCLLGNRLWKRWRSHQLSCAIRGFRLQREQLEAKFFDLARALGRPRGLRWIDCDWQKDVTFARDVQTGLLTAFVAVNIRFEAVLGGDMEDVEAVDTIRDAAAVFHYQRGRWGTGGRALFNMNPQNALLRLDGQFEPVSARTESNSHS